MTLTTPIHEGKEKDTEQVEVENEVEEVVEEVEGNIEDHENVTVRKKKQI